MQQNTEGRLGMNEMVTYLPISSPFIRFAGRYVDEAFGVAAGYNFFIFEAALVPFEIVACNVIIHYCKCLSSGDRKQRIVA